MQLSGCMRRNRERHAVDAQGHAERIVELEVEEDRVCRLLVRWENCGFEEKERRGKSKSSRSGLESCLGRLESDLGRAAADLFQSAAGLFQSVADLFQSDPDLGGLES